MNEKFAVKGNAYYSKNIDEVMYLNNCLICVDDNGIIEKVITENESDYENILKDYEAIGQLKVLNKDDVLLPGFIDLHIHAPQWPQAGLALDKPLEVWLNEYTFPLEAKYSDLDFAKKVYEDLVRTTLKNGTTTAMYFATIHKESSVLLAELCGVLGQRGLVGRVSMDDENGAPSFYRDDNPSVSINSTKSFIEEVTKLSKDFKQNVYPVTTPRFIPTCTDEALMGLGNLANKYNTYIQTHVSESDWEHNFVIDRIGVNDTVALNNFGLLTDRTILAHGNYVTEKDAQVLAETGATIAHCPLSNVYFANAVLPVMSLINQGVNIGLATDISGGYSQSMYNAIRQSIICSRMLQDGVDPSKKPEDRGTVHQALSLNNAFYLATVGGAIALKLPIGEFIKGCIFDAQVVNTSIGIPNFIKNKNDEDLLHKILLLASEQNIKEVWVQGNQVI